MATFHSLLHELQQAPDAAPGALSASAKSPHALEAACSVLRARLWRDLAACLDEARLPSWVALSKADLVGDAALEDVAARAARHLGGLRMPFPVLNAVSAATGEGLAGLQHTLLQVTKLHRLREADAAEHRRELSGMAAAAGARLE